MAQETAAKLKIKKHHRLYTSVASEEINNIRGCSRQKKIFIFSKTGFHGLTEAGEFSGIIAGPNPKNSICPYLQAEGYEQAGTARHPN